MTSARMDPEHSASGRTRRPRLRAAAAALLMLMPGLHGVARAQDGPPSLILDTEIEDILHQEADPIFLAAGLDPKAMKIHIVGDKTLPFDDADMARAAVAELAGGKP